MIEVLQCHKFAKPLGGAERYFNFVCSELESRGNKAHRLTTDYNLKDVNAKTTIPYQNLREDFNFSTIIKLIKAATSIFYNTDTAVACNNILSQHHIDIAHIHNIYYHMSTSLLQVLKKKGVPVVMTVHDYHLVCPNHSLFTKRKLCTKCIDGIHFSILKNKCIKGSVVYSLLGAVEKIYRDFFQFYEKSISAYIAPSLFCCDVLKKSGIKSSKIVHLEYPTCLDINTKPKKVFDENYILYVGKLEDKKGVDLIFDAARANPNQKFILAGDGVQRETIQLLANTFNNVKLTGFCDESTIQSLYSNARLVIVPSLWPEVSGMVIQEAMCFNKPILASNRGGIPEVLDGYKKGSLFAPEEKGDFIRKLERMLYKYADFRKTSINCKNFNDSKNDHFASLLDIYDNVINRRGCNGKDVL